MAKPNGKGAAVFLREPVGTRSKFLFTVEDLPTNYSVTVAPVAKWVVRSTAKTAHKMRHILTIEVEKLTREMQDRPGGTDEITVTVTNTDTMEQSAPTTLDVIYTP